MVPIAVVGTAYFAGGPSRTKPSLYLATDAQIRTKDCNNTPTTAAMMNHLLGFFLIPMLSERFGFGANSMLGVASLSGYFIFQDRGFVEADTYAVLPSLLCLCCPFRFVEFVLDDLYRTSS